MNNLCADGMINFDASLANQTITLFSDITIAQNATLRNPNAPGLHQRQQYHAAFSRQCERHVVGR
ncbi:MAG: hypothetical protein R3E08_11820 [Thiotrichaceae bacterium]